MKISKIKPEIPATKRLEAQLKKKYELASELIKGRSFFTKEEQCVINKLKKQIDNLEQIVYGTDYDLRLLDNFENITTDEQKEQALFHINSINPDADNSNMALLIHYDDISYYDDKTDEVISKPVFEKVIKTKKWIINNINKIQNLGTDTYISAALFAYKNADGKTSYGDNSVLTQNALIIDIDYKNIDKYNGLSAEEMYEIMKSDGKFNENIPEPSYIMQSSEGKGMYLVYCFSEPFLIYKKEANIKAWKYYSGIAIDYFTEYGADSNTCNCSRVFRIPSTYHTKTETWSRICYFDEVKNNPLKRFDSRTLFEGIKKVAGAFAPTTSSETEVSTVDSNVFVPPKRQNIDFEKVDAQTKISARLSDLETVLRIRKYNLNGLRNEFMFIYLTQLIVCVSDEIIIKERAYKINNFLSDPLSQGELDATINSAMKKSYKFKDETIIERLNLTSDEIAKLNSIGHSSKSRNEYLNNRKKQSIRTSNGQTKATRAKERRDEKIFSLREDGLSIRAIAKTLGISDRTVKNVLYKK